jgi:peroxiredoxin
MWRLLVSFCRNLHSWQTTCVNETRRFLFHPKGAFSCSDCYLGNVCVFCVIPTVIILCLPLLGSTLTDNLLFAVNSLRLAHLPNTTLIAVHLTSVTPFLPVPPTSTESSSIHEPTTTAPTTHTLSPEGYIYLQNPRYNARRSPKHTSTQLPKVAHTSHETFTSSDFLSTSEYTGTNPSYISIDTTSRATQTRRISRSIPGSGTTNILGSSMDKSSRWMRYSPAEDISQATKRAMLVLTVTESGVIVEELFSQGPAAGNFSRHPEVSVHTPIFFHPHVT